MSAPDEQPYDSSSRGRYTFPTGQRRVVTVPSWARNLPPDELSDDEYDPPSFGPASGRPPGPQRRSLSSILRPTRNGSFSNPPLSAGATTVKSGDPLLGDPDRQRHPTQGNSEASTSSSPSPGSPPPAPAPAKPAHIATVLQRGNSAGQGGDKGWWTFTLPSKYLDRVHGYVRPKEWNEKGKEREGEQDDDDMRSTHSQRSRRSAWSMGRLQSRNRDQEKQDYHRKMSQSMNVKLAPPNVFSINQTTIPGWSSPWVPFHRQENGREMQDPFDLSHREAAAEAASKKSRFENFILHNPFSPLFFRFINLVLNGCTLGLAAHIRLQETHAGVIGVIGTSTLFVIVIAPLAIVHIFVTVYIEYFGAPIGLWQIRTKMFYTLTDLALICLYSSALSLTFDDLFTSSLECTAYTPYARYNTPPLATGTANIEGTLADSICSQQIAQVVFIFLSVISYLVVLIISLFRIFAKVSRK
ncbi:hypothetical protein JCM5296_005777 [Sporobolomyces johnsonii]